MILLMYKLFIRQHNLTLSQILDSSKLKDLADDNFKFDGNVAKFSKRVENTVGKKRNCFPFPTVFSMDLYYKHVKNKSCLGQS